MNCNRIFSCIIFLVASCVKTTESPDPSITFRANRIAIESGDYVEFCGECTPEAEEWRWTFEGGDPPESVDKIPPPVYYRDTGIYDVTLQVIMNGKPYSLTRYHYIYVTDRTCIDDFCFFGVEAEKDTILPGEPVKVYAYASGQDLTYTWCKNTGSIRGSGPEITFSTCLCFSGLAEVSCRVEDRDGRSKTKGIKILVSR